MSTITFRTIDEDIVRLGVALTNASEKIAFVESSAGGFLSALAVSIPGASKWLDSSQVVYSNFSKEILTDLGRQETVNTAVASDAVLALAKAQYTYCVEGLLHKGRASTVKWVFAESGIAPPKPENSRSTKPVGLWFGCLYSPEHLKEPKIYSYCFTDKSRMGFMKQVAAYSYRLIATEVQSKLDTSLRM